MMKISSNRAFLGCGYISISSSKGWQPFGEHTLISGLCKTGKLIMAKFFFGIICSYKANYAIYGRYAQI
jgi:hypothetical protein